MSAASERLVDALASTTGHLPRQSGGQWQARCPAHEDRNPSLSVRPIDGAVLVHCHAGCDVDDVLAALNLTRADLYDERKATYRYDDGRTVHRTYSGNTKRFRQSGNTRATPTLYHLSRLLDATEGGVFLVEGEKDVHAIEALDGIATTAPMGAANFAKVDVTPLKGRYVTAIVDRDEKGQQWAEQVAAALDGTVAGLRFAYAKAGKDAADHIAAGYDLEEFEPVEMEFAAPGTRSSVPDTRGEEQRNTLYLDVAALLDGGIPDPPTPVLLYREDGNAIFYSGQVNYIFGDPESGKTLVAQAAASEALKAGRRVLFIDIDHNGAQATICRFIDMGVPEETLRDLSVFRYVEPEDKAHLMAVVADAKEWRPAVAVVDSIGELLPLLYLSSNSPDDFTLAHTAVLKPLAIAGAAVLAVDHLPKNIDSRASGPTGTAAKRRAVGGVSIRVTVNEQFTPGRGGSAFLSINKDRHGGLRRHCLAEGREPSAGLFTIISINDTIRWSVKVPKLGDAAAAAGVNKDDITALDKLDPPPTGVRDVKARMNWSSTRAADALREWRSQRSPAVPEEQGTLSIEGEE